MLLLKTIVTKKEVLTTITEDTTLEAALQILEESGFRCVPILDETGKKFLGNIYKMHIYKHKSEGGAMDVPVTHLLKNETKTIHLSSSFFKVFFTIKELPYIAVLNDEDEFYGILTHSALLNMLSQSWNIQEGRYVLTVASTGIQGDLATMSKIIAKYASIASCITLDIGKDEYIRRTIFTLPADTAKETVDAIIEKLEKKSFKVVEVEVLEK
ncbi:CBS domain-containing protein [Pilibacter termitis]|uniref:CBS domain-containing protein n=1 Tax=Pilibacter termitis TaxID=263852 RepID=A0A1T4NKH8_9ENTE|nr:cyclic di-AMP binding protein CbpA [Pilibacter termitis]SJZ79278.1 CBS domain-containing protein [Pilibacter termitis]